MAVTSVIEHADAFLEYLEVQKNYSGHTLKAYYGDVYEFLRYVAELSGIDPENAKAMPVTTAFYVIFGILFLPVIFKMHHHALQNGTTNP